jgi:hypothetical protein
MRENAKRFFLGVEVIRRFKIAKRVLSPLMFVLVFVSLPRASVAGCWPCKRVNNQNYVELDPEQSKIEILWSLQRAKLVNNAKNVKRGCGSCFETSFLCFMGFIAFVTCGCAHALKMRI